ncbi:MAG TPA: hypothetical protein VG273_05310 [Bryobacteraceae bacterium]|nr:hypothetical protein [Bryobacteraceae bacterium]
MKDQYFGDVNDFRKYGLLRALTLAGALRLGVCWMLTAEDSRTDGQFLRYLEDSKEFRGKDPELFDWLKHTIEVEKVRHVARIEKSNLLGNSFFHSQMLTDCEHARREYFTASRAALAGCDLVFFDPDNGIEIKSRPVGRKDSSKHLYWDEVSRTFEAGSSVLIYQHFIRENRAQFSARISEDLQKKTGAAAVFSFSTPYALFVLASQERHVALFAGKLQRIGEVWGKHIKVGAHPGAH